MPAGGPPCRVVTGRAGGAGSTLAAARALRDRRRSRAALDWQPDAVIHLAAVASGAEARRDPGARLGGERRGHGAAAPRPLRRCASRPDGDPLLLVVSTGEVYGAGSGAAARGDRCRCSPVSPYAASKVGRRGRGPRSVASRPGSGSSIARPFPHTGPGQTHATTWCRPSPRGCAAARASGRRAGDDRQPGAGARFPRRARRGRRPTWRCWLHGEAGRGLQRGAGRGRLAGASCSPGWPR